MKAKFLDNANYVVTAFGESMAIFDVRKPSIIVNEALKQHSCNAGEEINDIDVTVHGV